MHEAGRIPNLSQTAPPVLFGVLVFFLSRGVIVPHLLKSTQGMRSSEIMYDGWLSMAVEKAELLLCGVDLDG